MGSSRMWAAWRRVRGRCYNIRVSRTRGKQLPEVIRLALSIRQPWAEIILRGEKRFEYRSRSTTVRERIYLYAPMAVATADSMPECFTYAQAAALPLGFIVGSAEIINCVYQDDEDCYGYELAAIQRITPRRPKGRPLPTFWHEPP